MKQEWILLLRALMLAGIMAGALHVHVCGQSAAGLHSGYESYWKDDIAWLTKIGNEADGQQAAALLNRRKTEMLPKLERLLSMTRDFKKSATQAEQRKEEEWVMNNPLQEKDADMQASLQTNASSKGGEFARAVGDYMKAMMATIRKAK